MDVFTAGRRRERLRATLAAFIASLGLAAAAQAQAPASALKLEFLQPTGIVSPTDAIAVNLRLTNTDAGQAFRFDPTLGVTGLPASSLPSTAWAWNAATSTYEEVAFDRYSGFGIGVGYSCTSTFSKPDCQQGPYAFTFGNTGLNQGFVLAAGQSVDYNYGVLNPTGTTPGGTYTIYTAPLYLMVQGYSADNRALTGTYQLSNTCSASTAQCVADGLVFTRTVTAVPEPATAGLMGLGVAALLAVRRKRA